MSELPQEIKVCPVCEKVDPRPGQMYCSGTYHGKSHRLTPLQWYVELKEGPIADAYRESQGPTGVAI